MKELQNISLVDGGPTKSFEAAIEQGMQKTLDHFTHEIAKLRTGRANPAMVEDLIVSCYGSAMKLKEVAAITIPEPQQLVIQPWDKTLIGDIEKAITQSDLNINPVNDGNLIRLAMPRMSSERREELVKVLNKKLEESRIAIRTERESARKVLKDAEKAKTISEDYARRLGDLLQKITNKFIEMAEKIGEKKEAEVRSI